MEKMEALHALNLPFRISITRIFGRKRKPEKRGRWILAFVHILCAISVCSLLAQLATLPAECGIYYRHIYVASPKIN